MTSATSFRHQAPLEQLRRWRKEVVGGHDSDQHFAFHDRKAADFVAPHDLNRFQSRSVRRHRYWFRLHYGPHWNRLAAGGQTALSKHVQQIAVRYKADQPALIILYWNVANVP